MNVVHLRGRWNHNTHYHRLVLAHVPRGAMRALDVGCGAGDLLRELVRVVPDVVGLDVDAAILESAVKAAPDATLIHHDFLTYPFPAESFDFVTMVTSLHHMDARVGLARIRSLLRPGGVVVVVGMARPSRASDYVIEAAGLVASRVLRLFVGYRSVAAPRVWPPPHTYADARRIGLECLPGAVFRRRLFFRYTLVWTKPEREPAPSRRH